MKLRMMLLTLLVCCSLLPAAASGFANQANATLLQQERKISALTLQELVAYLAAQTHLTIVCAPESAGEIIALDIKAQQTLADVLHELQTKYGIRASIDETKREIKLFKGPLQPEFKGLLQMEAPVKFSGEARLRYSDHDVTRSYVSAPTLTAGKYGVAPGLGLADREEYAAVAENRFSSAAASPLSTFSIDVDTASYSNIRRFLQGGKLPERGAVRIEEMINYFLYEYPQPDAEHPFNVSTELSSCPWNPAHSLIRIGLQGRNIDLEQLPPTNLVFLVDVSGSMNEANKLPLVKTMIKMLAGQLRPQDNVSIVTYASNTQIALESVAGSEKKKIYDAVDALSAGGSTNGGSGIQMAYEMARKNLKHQGNNRILLATDGDFNVGAQSEEDLLRLIKERRDDGVYLSVFGFGMGNYKDKRMELLADNGNGNYAYIDNAAELQKVAASQLTGTLFTIANDVKLQLEFNPAKVKEYKLVGYENRLLNKEDFNDDKKDAGDMGAGHAVTALYELIPAATQETTVRVDALTYQQTQFVPSDDLLQIKVRYKLPKQADSRLLTKRLPAAEQRSLAQTSNDFRFAAAVAEFGMLLRNSEFKGQASYEQVLTLAKGAKGNDAEGYRAEFIKLVEIAKWLPAASEKQTNELK